MWCAIGLLVCIASAAAPSYAQSVLVISPMPNSTDAIRTGSVEQLTYAVPLACPDSGGVLRYHRELLEPQGFTLCTSADVKWLRTKTATHDVLSYESILARESSGEFVILDVECVLKGGEGIGLRQAVSVRTIRNGSLTELKRVYGVRCE